MHEDDRDRNIVEQILRYCDQIEIAHDDFGHSRNKFDSSPTYQNAVSMCILQIGELVGRLSDTFKSQNNMIPWQKIRGMRNYVAHQYGHVDFEIVWFVATESIYDIKNLCESYLYGKTDIKK